MSDVVAQAKAALEGITPGPWEHHIAPHPDEQATHAEWLAGTLIGEGESLHVLTAPSPEPRFAYVVPAVTGDGPTSAKNADFIAAARALVPALVAEVERLRAAVGGGYGGTEMSDGTGKLRIVLADAIRAHQLSDGRCLGCGERATYQSLHQADALLSLTGIDITLAGGVPHA